jgi:hypothetical protein
MVFLNEGMAGRVQDFVTLRIGSLWVDVPLGPVQASDSDGSLRTTAASPNMIDHDQEEVNSTPQDDFTPVVTKASKRRARRAAAKAREAATQKRNNNVRKVVASPAAPPSPSQPKVAKLVTHKMEPSFRRTTLGEWPVHTKLVSPTKAAQPNVSPKMPGAYSSEHTPSILGVPPTNAEMVVTPSIPNKGVVLSNEPRESATVKKTNPPERANKGKSGGDGGYFIVLGE